MRETNRIDPARHRGAFTIIELVAALLIVVLLAATFVPYAMSLREKSSRVHCTSNLKNIWNAMTAYGQANGYFYPRTRFGPALGNSWTAFTGPDERNPFAPDSTVQMNDVSASLWLLMREGLAQPDWFVCPSSAGEADRMLDATGASAVAKQRGNFRGNRNLTYAFASPFSAIEEYRLSDTLPARFALLGDQGQSFEKLNNDPPSFTASATRLSQINSVNHHGAGQNVLYADGSIVFETSPYCGVGRTKTLLDGDNIYTALAATVLINQQPKHNEPGVAGTTIGPAYRYDSYLIPPAGYKSE